MSCDVQAHLVFFFLPERAQNLNAPLGRSDDAVLSPVSLSLSLSHFRNIFPQQFSATILRYVSVCLEVRLSKPLQIFAVGSARVLADQNPLARARALPHDAEFNANVRNRLRPPR